MGGFADAWSAVKGILSTAAGDSGSISTLFKGISKDNLAGAAMNKRIAGEVSQAFNEAVGYANKAGLKNEGEILSKALDEMKTGFAKNIDAAKGVSAFKLSDEARGAFDTIAKNAASIGDDSAKIFDNFNDVLTKYNSNIGKGISGAEEFFGRTAGTGIGWKNTIGAYTAGTAGGKRAMYTAAGVGVAGVGVRYLQGGSLTRKANGERDIAGVPFI